MNATLAQRIVERWRDMDFADAPERVASLARLHFMDAVGVGLAAATLEVAEPLRRAVEVMGAGGRSTGFASEAPLPAASAALMNGSLIHSLEYDDTHIGSIVHGSAVIAAAAFAVAEQEGASGAALLSAYAKGWEVLVRIGLAAPGRFQAAGFQLTSVGGAPVAALVAADLMGLDDEARVNAMGIALSQASGVFEFLSDGATVKTLHPGWAAHAGVVAAGLAAGGMTGPKTSLEGRFGLYAAFARGDGEAARRLSGLLDDLGARWHLADAAFKFHPCCHYIHPFLECLGKALADGPNSVASIDCRVPPGAAPIICEPWERKLAPASGYEAKFSLPYALAAQLRDGGVSLDTFAGPADPELAEIARRISWEPMHDADFPARFQAALTVRLVGGGEREAAVDDVYGGPSRPAGASQVEAKFLANAGRALGGAAERLRDALARLDELDDVSSLGRALAH